MKCIKNLSSTKLAKILLQDNGSGCKVTIGVVAGVINTTSVITPCLDNIYSRNYRYEQFLDIFTYQSSGIPSSTTHDTTSKDYNNKNFTSPSTVIYGVLITECHNSHKHCQSLSTRNFD